MQEITKQEIEATQTISYIMRLLPFVNSNRRSKGFDETFKTPYGMVRILARETLNAFDAKVFFAFSYLIQTSEVADGGVIKYNDRDVELLRVTTTQYNFLTNYMHEKHGGNTAKVVFDSFVRLSDCKWIFWIFLDDKHSESTTSRIIFDIKQNKDTSWTILFSKKYYEMLKDKKEILTASNRLIQACKNNTAVLLAIFLQSQKNSTAFSSDVLIKALHLKENSRHEMRSLERAFSELKAIGLLKNYEKQARKDDTYWRFELDQDVRKQLHT